MTKYVMMGRVLWLIGDMDAARDPLRLFANRFLQRHGGDRTEIRGPTHGVVWLIAGPIAL